jgi:two-component system nitrogen regulation response regulator GlnG
VDAGNGTEDGRARALTDLSGEAASLAVNGGLDVNGLPVAVGSVSGSVTGWESGLEQEALALLNAGHTDVWDVLTRRFETSLIQSALATTRGRRIEAAQKLGIGRNTITRKIQELGIDEA